MNENAFENQSDGIELNRFKNRVLLINSIISKSKNKEKQLIDSVLPELLHRGRNYRVLLGFDQSHRFNQWRLSLRKELKR